jgi:hypothetical protein
MLGTIGKLSSVTVMFVRICKWTEAKFWTDAMVMVIVACLAASFGRFFPRLLIPAA